MSPGVDTDADRLTEVRTRVASALEPLLRVDDTQYDRLFTLVLTAFVAVLLALTLQYPSETRLMPLVVGVPTLVLLVGLLVVQFSSRVAAMTGGLATGDVLGMEDQVDEVQSRAEGSADAAATADETEPFGGRMAVVAMSFWVLFLFALVLTIGFTVGIPAYLVLYYRLRAGLSWVRTVVLTLFVWLFIVVIFIYVLNAPLYPGVLGVTVPFLG